MESLYHKQIISPRYDVAPHFRAGLHHHPLRGDSQLPGVIRLVDDGTTELVELGLLLIGGLQLVLGRRHGTVVRRFRRVRQAANVGHGLAQFGRVRHVAPLQIDDREDLARRAVVAAAAAEIGRLAATVTTGVLAMGTTEVEALLGGALGARLEFGHRGDLFVAEETRACVGIGDEVRGHIFSY